MLASAAGMLVMLMVAGCADEKIGEHQTMTTLPEHFYNATDVRRGVADTVTLAKGDNLSGTVERLPGYQRLMHTKSYDEMALAFVAYYRKPLRLADPRRELLVTKVQADDLGYHQVRFSQVYRDIPVLESEMLVHFDPHDHVYLIQNQCIETPIALNVIPNLSAAQVTDLVVTETKNGAVNATPTLGIARAENEGATLVYRLEIRRSMIDKRIVLIDANSGVTLRDVPMVYNSR